MEVQDNIIDFNKICRLCLMEESVMSSIYNETDKHSSAVPLRLRIMACVSIELNSIDGLPSQICTTCLCQVDGWYKFKDLCETADAVLKKWLKNEPVQLETISEIRSRAKEVRQFFASPHLVKVDGLDSAFDHPNPAKKSLEIAVKKEDEMVISPPHSPDKYIVYLSPHTFLKHLRSEYKLSDGVTLKEVIKGSEGRSSDYEIAFESHIEKPLKKTRSERLLLQMGEWQLLEVSPYAKEASPTADSAVVGDEDRSGPSGRGTEETFGCTSGGMGSAVANYRRTKEFLEKALRERGNAQEEVIENVVYTFRLDEEGQVDVVNIVEGVRETHPQRGFRYACLFCSEMVVNKLVYDKHIRERHFKLLVCRVCDKQLHSLRNLLIHTKTHLGVYTFTCPVCGKGLTRASIFKSHMMYHFHGKVQKCQICEKRFRDVFALRRHVQLHDKKIEYVCELCGFGTHLKSNLEYHVRAHGKEKSYMCEVCGKQFAAPQGLRHHIKTHEPNFPCPHCKRVFRHETKFRHHLIQNHPEFASLEDEDFGDEQFQQKQQQQQQLYEGIHLVDECFM